MTHRSVLPRPAAATDRTDLAGLAAAENFPVAMRLLPPATRTHLQAVYDVARTIDDLGDEAAGDRTALLREFALDLETVWTSGNPRAPVLRRLVGTARAAGLTPQPFRDLVAANLQDQTVRAYPTHEDLLIYCRLSGAPVGRLVLQLFSVRDPRAVPLSDDVCVALQLVEHWQDVAEDRRSGRVYLPQADLAMHGVVPDDLAAGRSSPAVRALLAQQTDRAAALLASGRPLVGLLRGWARLAVAGYVAGGLATVDALRRPGTDVLASTPRPRRRDLARHLVRLLARRSGGAA